MKKALVALMLLALACWLYPCPPKAVAQETSTDIEYFSYTSEDINIKNSVLQPPKYTPPLPEPTTKNKPVPVRAVPTGMASGRHNTRAETKISVEQLNAFLSAKGSPLASHSRQILDSPYWSTIIGICTIEQYSCARAPYNNYWGLMKRGGGLQHFATLEDGIAAIDAFLAKGEANHPTIESMRGWYCASACTNWEPTVIRVKTQLEQLK